MKVEITKETLEYFDLQTHLRRIGLIPDGLECVMVTLLLHPSSKVLVEPLEAEKSQTETDKRISLGEFVHNLIADRQAWVEDFLRSQQRDSDFSSMSPNMQ